MCGIVATWGKMPASLAEAMAGKIVHRGLDGSGLTSLPKLDVALAHRRLSIIDPEGGQQPLACGRNDGALVANGMIYNDLQLRDALGGSHFSTQSDSESILQTCLQRGSPSVAELDGMFAFVMTAGDKLIAARDPIGIKPLYIGRRDDAYCFASEIKALSPYIDDIREFPPGHVFDSELGMHRYYSLPQATDDIQDSTQAIQLIRQTLSEAIEKRLRSDVPLGVFLSGGLDSSIIAALASRFRPGLKSFSVGLADSPDLVAARHVADYLGTDHYEYVLSQEEIQRDLPQILYHLESFDQDLVRSAIPCYYVSRLAAQHVKVVLTGEGADELFAGYDYHKTYRHPTALQAELRRSVLSMHNINLQRVDRMTMAHAVEARVPFLDRSMLDLAFRIPVSFKLPEKGRIEKWILRKAFEDVLPADIVWRDKSQFDQGSGVANLFGESPLRARASGDAMRIDTSRSSEEAGYRKLLIGQFENSQAVLGLVAHWDDSARIDDRSPDMAEHVAKTSHSPDQGRAKFDLPNDDFSSLYNLKSPQRYFRRMKDLDYEIPASASRVYRWCIDEIRRIQDKQALTVLDLCAGYGINGALMKNELSMDEIYAYFADGKPATVCDPFFDRLSLQGRETDNDLNIVGLDIAESALAYGQAAGFMNEVCAIDLESDDIPAELEQALCACSLITITGGFSFIGTKTFEKILVAVKRVGAGKPWIAGFPLLHADLSELTALLESHGYVLQTNLTRRLRQRRFANPSERRREYEALDRADIAPQEDAHFESRLLLAKPPATPDLPSEILNRGARWRLVG